MHDYQNVLVNHCLYQLFVHLFFHLCCILKYIVEHLYYFHLVPDIYGGILEMSGHSEGLILEVDDGREE